MKILIIGAGICGLAIAKRLQDTDFDVTIVDKEDAQQSISVGICLPANAVEGLRKLGLYPSLMSIAHQVSTIEYAKANGETLAKASLLEPPFNKGEFVSVLRSDLMALISETVTQKIHWGTSAQIRENNTDGVRVSFNQKEESQLFDLVIAADGIHSPTREAIFPNSYAKKLGLSTWRFVVNNTRATPEPVYYLGNDETFVIYPLPNAKAYCYGHMPSSKVRTSSGQATAREALLNAFKLYNREVLHKIHQLSEDDTQVIRGELESVQLANTHSGRVVLIGDALHGCPPTLEQGVGMGLEDIHTLTDLLSENSIDETLILFEQQRLPRVKWVVEESNNIIRHAAKGSMLVGRFFRNSLIRRRGPANVVGWKKLLTESV